MDPRQEPDHPQDAELDPQQAERVRRLLAEARHTEPIPADVAARLDRVIADLGAESGDLSAVPDPAPGTGSGTAVVGLRQRRRRAGRVLLAAAAVVAGGVAVGQLLGGSPLPTSGDAESSTAGSAAEDQALRAPDRDAGRGGKEEGAGEASVAPLPGALADSTRTFANLPPQRVRSDRFVSDARRLQAVAVRPGSGEKDRASPPRSAPGVTDGDRAACDPGLWGGGRYLRVVLDREAGWMVFRPPRGGTQVVDLFLCEETTVERSATLPFG